MSFDPITALFETGKMAIERIWPDPIRRAEEMRKLEEMKQTGDLARLDAHVKLMLGQLEVNKAEAQHKSIFVAGWRPAVGWVCVSVLAFNYIGVYLLEFAVAFMDKPPAAPTRFDMTELWPVLIGMLGIGTMRSVDKRNNVQTDSI
jgi:hypothetical protein